MEHDGILVDAQALHDFGEMLSERIDACESLIFGYAGETFNLNSTRQLGVFLFETLGLPPVKKTKSGYSTNAEVLEKLQDRHPAVEAILDYRTLTKLKSTYADGLQKVIGPTAASARRSRTWSQRRAAFPPRNRTCRISRCAPNWAAKFDACSSRAPAGCLSTPTTARLSCVCWRISRTIRACRRRSPPVMDIHAVTAAQVFGVAAGIRHAAHAPPCQGRELRHCLRHFGVLAGGGYRRDRARKPKAYIDRYLENYSGVRAYMHDIVEKAKQDGFVTTLFARRAICRSSKAAISTSAPVRSALRSTRPFRARRRISSSWQWCVVAPCASGSCKPGLFCRSTTS